MKPSPFIEMKDLPDLPPANELVQKAFEKIQPDGTVKIFEEEFKRWQELKPMPSVNLTLLDELSFRSHVKKIINEIENLYSGYPFDAEEHMQWFAHKMTAYKNYVPLIFECASKIEVEGRKIISGEPHIYEINQPSTKPNSTF